MTTYQAKKIEAGNYEYRGYQIIRVECKADNYIAWNMFDTDGYCYDAAPTLSIAKHMIDRSIDFH